MHCVAVGGTGVTCVQGHNLPSSAPFVCKNKVASLGLPALRCAFSDSPRCHRPKVMIYTVWILHCQCNDICVDSALSV